MIRKSSQPDRRTGAASGTSGRDAAYWSNSVRVDHGYRKITGECLLWNPASVPLSTKTRRPAILDRLGVVLQLLLELLIQFLLLGAAAGRYDQVADLIPVKNAFRPFAANLLVLL